VRESEPPLSVDAQRLAPLLDVGDASPAGGMFRFAG